MTEDLGFNASILAMVYFVKMSIITINYRDGNGDLNKVMTEREKYYQLKDIPTFSDYAIYMFGLPSCIVGPPYEYRNWFEFISKKGQYAKMKAFTNYRTALTRLFQAFVCTAISQILNSYFPKEYLLEPSFDETNYAYKMLHTVGSMQSVIWNYFSGFCILEANLIACGLGYANPDAFG